MNPEPKSAAPPDRASALASLRATFARWLHLPDDAPLLALLGAAAANMLAGDPVWLLLVAPPGSGKTELLESLHRVPEVHRAAAMTEASLLSGTPKKEHASGARGGLLREIGERGILLLKDFGSVLSMNRDERARVLAALREIYDGNWTRHVGTEGGRTLSWSGSIGIIAGCPPTIDSHHAVMASLGERFLTLRFGDSPTEAHTRKALAHAGRERGMREELAAAVAALFAAIRLVDAKATLSPGEESRLVSLAMFVSRCRSSVERDGYSREVVLVPGAESPTRLAVTLRRLFDGLVIVGVARARAWAVVRRVAVDSMPAIRRSVLAAVLAKGEPETTSVATAIGYPTGTTRRALEDLAAYQVLHRLPAGSGKADRWQVGESVAALLQTVPEMSAGPGSVPEMSDGPGNTAPSSNTKHTNDDFSGKVSVEAVPETDDDGAFAARLARHEWEPRP